ncbi:hypothetical protein PIIN_07469 [Serendipita indica DSM 11827]|uniref:Uncharacterized protein n=1 Tax=Serendipita indica (strain DSM 11827) TaxID=1109443 RepID=G4TQC3_SERID|nr:hypothetical protein PIIN_07469 [Serendipita indica DSM 11827]
MADSTKPNGKPTIVRAVAKKSPQTEPERFSVVNIAQQNAWQVPILVPMLYLAAIPLAEYAARLRLISFIMNKIGPLALWILSGFDSNAWNGVKIVKSDGNGSLANSVLITSLFYSFVVYVVSAVISIAGQAAGNQAGYQNHEPRKGKESLTGYCHRMVSAHANLMETFPLFAISVLFTQMIAPNNEHLVELVCLQAFAKTFVYIPSYISNVDLPRTISHFLSVGAALRTLTILAIHA